MEKLLCVFCLIMQKCEAHDSLFLQSCFHYCKVNKNILFLALWQEKNGKQAHADVRPHSWQAYLSIKKVCQWGIIGTLFLMGFQTLFTLQERQVRFALEPVNLAPQEPVRPVPEHHLQEPVPRRSPVCWRRWCSAAVWRSSRARFPLSRP